MCRLRAVGRGHRTHYTAVHSCSQGATARRARCRATAGAARPTGGGAPGRHSAISRAFVRFDSPRRKLLIALWILEIPFQYLAREQNSETAPAARGGRRVSRGLAPCLARRAAAGQRRQGAGRGLRAPPPRSGVRRKRSAVARERPIYSDGRRALWACELRWATAATRTKIALNKTHATHVRTTV